MGLLTISMSLSPQEGEAAEGQLSLYPRHEVRRDFAEQNILPGRVSLTSFWFINYGNRCTTGLDSLAFLWLTTRLMFVCPYATGRTALAVELAPEIQWPSGESVRQTARPGLRLTHIQNTRLSDTLENVFRLSTKFAWEDSVQNQAPNLDKRPISQSILQDWSDLFDQAYQVGLIYRATREAQTVWLVEFEQTLPTVLRQFNPLLGSAIARWSRLGGEFRWRTGDWVLGGGVHYGSLAFDWLQISFFYPTLSFGYELGGTGSRG